MTYWQAINDAGARVLVTPDDVPAVAGETTCRDCGGQIERVDAPLPAYAAPAPWWFHVSQDEARWCPGTGPVLPVTLRENGHNALASAH